MRIVVALLAVLSCALAAQAAFPWHTFETDAQGWRFADGSDSGAPSSVGLGGAVYWDQRGNPEGALSAPDIYYQTWVGAPADFLGDQSEMYGRSFSYDMFVRSTDNIAYTGICITGGGLGLAYDAFIPQVGIWETREVILSEAHWHTGGPTGPLATPEQMQAVLADLTGLFFCTEWHTGDDDTSIDNVGVMPEPGSLLALGAVLLTPLLRRRSA